MQRIVTRLYNLDKELTDTDYKALPCLYGYTRTDLKDLYCNIFEAYQHTSFDNSPSLVCKLYEDCVNLEIYISKH